MLAYAHARTPDVEPPGVSSLPLRADVKHVGAGRWTPRRPTPDGALHHVMSRVPPCAAIHSTGLPRRVRRERLMNSRQQRSFSRLQNVKLYLTMERSLDDMPRLYSASLNRLESSINRLD